MLKEGGRESKEDRQEKGDRGLEDYITITQSIYSKPLIVIVRSDTMETSLVLCLEHCYSCYSLVTIHSNELVIPIFHVITFYGNDRYRIITKSIYMYL